MDHRTQVMVAVLLVLPCMALRIQLVCCDMPRNLDPTESGTHSTCVCNIMNPVKLRMRGLVTPHKHVLQLHTLTCMHIVLKQ